MLNKYKTMKKAIVFLFLTILGVAVFSLPIASAQLIEPGDAPGAITTATGGEGSIKELARTIVDYFLAFLGFVATLVVIYGGILYVTAGGNQENADKGKKLLMYAVVGIIIILASYAIVNTILVAAEPAAG